jgi:hypothetical protein
VVIAYSVIMVLIQYLRQVLDMRVGHLEHRSHYSHIVSSFEEISPGVLQVLRFDLLEESCRESQEVRGAKCVFFSESVFNKVTRSDRPADHPQRGHPLFQMQVFAVNNKRESQNILIDHIEQRQHLPSNQCIIPIDQHDNLMILAT